MTSDIDDFLDQVDQWKTRVYEQLKQLTPKQRAAFWARMGERARDMGLRVLEPEKPAKPAAKRVRRTG
jgi:hypothetical protein